MESAICKSKVKAFTKDPLKLTTEQDLGLRGSQTQISTKESTKWANFMEKAFTYGLLERALRAIFMKD